MRFAFGDAWLFPARPGPGAHPRHEPGWPVASASVSAQSHAPKRDRAGRRATHARCLGQGTERARSKRWIGHGGRNRRIESCRDLARRVVSVRHRPGRGPRRRRRAGLAPRVSSSRRAKSPAHFVADRRRADGTFAARLLPPGRFAPGMRPWRWPKPSGGGSRSSAKRRACPEACRLAGPFILSFQGEAR